MLKADSVDKIVGSYFAVLTRERFVYKEKEYLPKPLRVSPLLLRGYTCPPMCGGCCLRFSLDYLPTEKRPPEATPRTLDFNGRKVSIFTDPQTENEGRQCKHLSPKDGRCGIYLVRPFTCDFELIRVLVFENGPTNTLTQKLYGRGWSYPRVDGGKGALCEMTPVSPETIADVLRKLGRCKEWADHFKLKTWLPEIIDLIVRGRLINQVTFGLPKHRGLLDG